MILCIIQYFRRAWWENSAKRVRLHEVTIHATSATSINRITK